MATSIKKNTMQRGTATNNTNQGDGILCKWERIGNIVTVTGLLSRGATSWTIFNGLPPLLDLSSDYDKAIICRTAGGHDVYITQDGTIQVGGNTFTEKYPFSGSYLCG